MSREARRLGGVFGVVLVSKLSQIVTLHFVLFISCQGGEIELVRGQGSPDLFSGSLKTPSEESSSTSPGGPPYTQKEVLSAAGESPDVSCTFFCMVGPVCGRWLIISLIGVK